MLPTKQTLNPAESISQKDSEHESQTADMTCQQPQKTTHDLRTPKKISADKEKEYKEYGNSEKQDIILKTRFGSVNVFEASTVPQYPRTVGSVKNSGELCSCDPLVQSSGNEIPVLPAISAALATPTTSNNPEDLSALSADETSKNLDPLPDFSADKVSDHSADLPPLPVEKGLAPAANSVNLPEILAGRVAADPESLPALGKKAAQYLDNDPAGSDSRSQSSDVAESLSDVPFSVQREHPGDFPDPLSGNVLKPAEHPGNAADLKKAEISPDHNSPQYPLAVSRPKGLVLGGGGAKGCYHVGLWQAFDEHGIHFDAVTGTSIGALVGSFYVEQNIEAVTDFVMGMTPTEIARELPKLPVTVKEKVKGTRTILEFIMKYKDDKMDITPLRNHFNNLFDYERFHNSPIAFGCMTFNDTRQEPRGYLKDQITAENAHDVLMASAACYPAFPKVEMEGELYMDGGYADNVPIALMAEAAPHIADEDILVVDLHGPQDPVPPALTEKMTYIQPLLDPGNSIDFSREHATRLYNQGYLEGLKYLEENPGYLYTFTREDDSLINVMENYLDSQMELHQIVLPDAANMARNTLSFALGYTPFELPNKFNQNYEYGRIIEALALMARVEPVALYDYRAFLKQVMENLSGLHLTNVPSNDFKMIEMLGNLKRDELTVQLHRMLVNGQGKLPGAIEKMKDRIPTSYTLAYVWYFAEELVKNLS